MKSNFVLANKFLINDILNYLNLEKDDILHKIRNKRIFETIMTFKERFDLFLDSYKNTEDCDILKMCHINGEKYAMGDSKGLIKLWNEFSCLFTFEINKHKGEITDLITFNETLIISSSKDNFIKIWDLSKYI